MGVMRVLNSQGDTALAWDLCDAISVDAATSAFDRLLQDGYQPFTVSHDGGHPELARTFDPSVDEVLWVRPLQGG